MGKKDKKKQGLGKAKTEAKQARKANKARNASLAAAGEDDVEAILAAILSKEKLDAAVTVVADSEPPSPRSAFTMLATPGDDALVLFGGEHYSGDRADYFATTHAFAVDKALWTRYDSATRPPPRSGHAAVMHRGFMYVFGGEFSNKSLTQYRHYRDLWRLDLEDFSWEKIDARGGPSARSGHRMCVVKGKLLVFGGYFDSGFGENKYYNDLHYIDLTADEFAWTKVETQSFDLVPSPRSGFQWTVFGEEVWLYGGYCREVADKAKAMSHKSQKKGGASAAAEMTVARGVVHSDLFKLDGDSLKWRKVKRQGYGPSRRSGFSVAVHGRSFVVFGGVEDETETEEDLSSVFYNDIFGFNVDRKRWYPQTIRKRKAAGGGGRRRRRKKGEDNVQATETGGQADSNEASPAADGDGEDGDDGDGDEDDDAEIDTVALEAALKKEQEEEVGPCGRFNTATAIIKNVLYIMGGVVEKKEADVTLDDMWSIDLKKLDEFRLVKPLSEKCAEWVASDDEEDEEDSDDDDDDEDDDGMDDGEDGDEEDLAQRRKVRRKRLQERVAQEDDMLMPRVFESLKEYFDRSRNHWFAEVHESLGKGGKGARRIAFEWAFKKYWELKPQLKELEAIEAEIREEARLEEEFAKAKVDQRRGHNRR